MGTVFSIDRSQNGDGNNWKDDQQVEMGLVV